MIINNPLSSLEKRATLSIATIFALRMLGLFMIVPIFTLYAHTLSNATPLLIGIAIGCYGLTQAALQIPFGMWSDHQGRKSIIALGLIIFAIGSLVCATSHNIWGIILGRSLQGAGAVGSATSALLADLTSEQNRTKAMAAVGATIGCSFFMAMLLGPLLSNWFNANSIFWLSVLLGLLGLVVLYKWVPNSTQLTSNKNKLSLNNFFAILFQRELRYLNISILILHILLTANFVVLPLMLQNSVGLAEKYQWHIYLPVLLLAFICMIPFIILAEKKQQLKLIFLITISLLVCAEVLLWLSPHSLIGTAVGLWLFFTAFTALEAILPSAVSKLAPVNNKGAALGINSCYQFFGIFLGGTLGGFVYSHWQISGVFLMCVLLTVVWFLLTGLMQYSSRTIRVQQNF